MTIYVDVEISSVRDREHHSAGALRVSAASMLTWIPVAVLGSAGINRERTLDLRRPDGTIFTRWRGAAIVCVEGRATVEDVLFCEPGDEPVIGWHALSGLNLELDERTGQLIDRGPIPAAHVAA